MKQSINPKVIIVVLRQPTNIKDEMRSDPFWEFGSFGITGCHQHNLLNHHKIEELRDARLAFAQAGPDGFKLVHLTPPIYQIRVINKCTEVKWQPCKMPFKYVCAPLIINNDAETDFPLLKQMLNSVKGKSCRAKFASKFRSRRHPLEPNVTNELIQVFEQKSSSAANDNFSSSYDEALPPNMLPKKDIDRYNTYQTLLANLQNKQNHENSSPARRC